MRASLVACALVLCACVALMPCLVDAANLERRRVKMGATVVEQATATARNPGTKAARTPATKGKAYAKGQGAKKLLASLPIDDSADGKAKRAFRRSIGQTFVKAKCTTLGCIVQKLTEESADTAAAAAAAAATTPNANAPLGKAQPKKAHAKKSGSKKVGGRRSFLATHSTAASAATRLSKQKRRVRRARATFPAVNCALTMPTWAQYEQAVRDEQQVTHGLALNKLRVRAVTAKTGALRQAKKQLDDWHAAPVNAQRQLVDALQIARVTLTPMTTIQETRFDAALRDVAANRHFRRTGMRKATRNRREARGTSYATTNALLMACVSTYATTHMNVIAGAPAVQLTNFVWYPASTNTPQAIAGKVLVAGNAGGNTCGTLPVYQSAAVPMTPGLSLTVGGYAGYLMPLGIELTAAGVPLTDTWVHTAFVPSECHYNIVPATAQVWMSDGLSGCHVYAATNANDELLIIHANANVITVATHQDDNYKAKLQCARQMLDHVNGLPAYLAAPFTPYDQLVHSTYTGHMTGGEVIPWGTHTGVGVWTFQYNESHLPAGPGLPGTVTAHAWTGAAPLGHWTNGGVGGVTGPTNLAHQRRWPKALVGDPDPCA